MDFILPKDRLELNVQSFNEFNKKRLVTTKDTKNRFLPSILPCRIETLSSGIQNILGKW